MFWSSVKLEFFVCCLKISCKRVIDQDVFLRNRSADTAKEKSFPIVRLRPQGSVKRCPLLKDQKCLVHDVKPTVCAMFPIGRYLTLSADDSFPKNPEELSVGYIFNNPECGDGIETHTVREWFRSFNIPLKDDYFFTWTRTQATLCKHLQFLEEHISEKTMIQYGMLL